jgi:aspartate 1-decarboxylase
MDLQLESTKDDIIIIISYATMEAAKNIQTMVIFQMKTTTPLT